MAQATTAARDAAQASPAAEPEFSLRPLKNRLQTRFPSVKSSHLSEAIAVGLGFNTNAALRAELSGPESWLLEYKTLDTGPFHRRLVELGYPLQADFSFGPQPVSPTPPAHYLEWLRQLRELERAPDKVWGRIHALRDLCANEFAKTFGIGHLEAKDDKRIIQRWEIGVDHGACLPNWGGKFNSNSGGYVDFPGSDHRVRFYETLPLAKGKGAEYECAMVSMPYADKNRPPLDFEEAAHLAGRIGWACSQHNEWSWYAPGSTALVLFKRSTPHTAMLQAWDRSFQRWLLENRSALTKGASQVRKYVIADNIYCSHLPVDLKNFEDCRERYLKEFAPHLYHDRDKGMAQVFERLMEKWLQDWHQDATAA